MQLHILNSGSNGNCYIFENEHTALILECGVHFKEVKQALNFNLSKVAGALLTHEHKDHSKYLKDFIAAGINVYASAGTLAAEGATSHRAKAVKHGEVFTVGEFKVYPFNVKHDCAEPLGFLINHKEIGNTLFLTDTYYAEYRFRGLNNMLVEANYSKEIIAKRFMAGTLHSFLKDRILQSHMSLETCKQLLKANDLSAVENIVLIHLSDRNSDAAIFQQEVRELTGKQVYVADKGMKLNFSLNAF